jgi:hypothetical protein
VTWTATEGSHVFQEWISQMYQVSGTGYTGIDSDTTNVALFNNTGTPDRTATVANTAYGAAATAWATANEQTDATNWVAGGRALAGKTFTFPTGGTFMFDATDLAGGGNMTVANVYGCQLYDNTITAGTVAKQGISFHYFGGVQGVTAGTFTIIWNVLGLHRATV